MAHIPKELSAQEMALLVNRLQMPLIARDYMDAGLSPEDDTIFALHELMSNLEPSMALLCAALTLQEIAMSHDGLTYLNEVCSKIIEKYSPEGLYGSEISSDIKTDLSNLLSDLEHIQELTEMCQMTFEIVRPETLAFLNIMIPQINAQIIIVEEIIRLRSIKSALSMTKENSDNTPARV